MAELAIKVGHGANYEDGDILDTFNRRRRLLVFAEHICWPRIHGRKIGGQLGATQPLLEKMYQRTVQYKWERASKTEVKRTNLWTLGEVVYGSTPIDDPDRHGHKIHCHVEEHFKFRNKSGKLPLFGKPDREIEYGGGSKRDAATVELLWDDIEHDTPLRRADHALWPAGADDLKVHLFLAVDEFDDATAEELKAPLYDEKSIEEDKPVLKKRKHHIDWRAATNTSLSASDIEDRTRSVDIRGEHTFQRAKIVLSKTAKK